jgi:hypothetical protein
MRKYASKKLYFTLHILECQSLGLLPCFPCLSLDIVAGHVVLRRDQIAARLGHHALNGIQDNDNGFLLFRAHHVHVQVSTRRIFNPFGTGLGHQRRVVHGWFLQRATVAAPGTRKVAHSGRKCFANVLASCQLTRVIMLRTAQASSSARGGIEKHLHLAPVTGRAPFVGIGNSSVKDDADTHACHGAAHGGQTDKNRACKELHDEIHNLCYEDCEPKEPSDKSVLCPLHISRAKLVRLRTLKLQVL